ncbi:hypothetical protein [Pontibacillus litoralis]|uniref:Uncharacterized protein n=1 Tax=Pontibacillus litoralis JSM 072002 TaxID=1385512 RepID=A0A0A5GDA6_9BACI|nr:hypothetical protein [Pontibacillus litoralis]KGX89193.1 hypothetical protein N784_00890 [Pontibacillus litoralis JSM 072002]
MILLILLMIFTVNQFHNCFVPQNIGMSALNNIRMFVEKAFMLPLERKVETMPVEKALVEINGASSHWLVRISIRIFFGIDLVYIMKG